MVDNPEFIDGITAIYKKYNPEAAADASFKNMFRNAPTVVFIANDPSYDCSQIDCGLLGGNMILAAQSMGIGSCCLGGPARFMRTPEAAEYLKKLEFSKGYELLYCIAFGYPDEAYHSHSAHKSHPMKQGLRRNALAPYFMGVMRLIRMIARIPTRPCVLTPSNF